MAIGHKLHEVLDSTVGSGTFAKVGADVSGAIHEKVLSGGESLRGVFDALHGKPLGHPLHPALTDMTVGSWTLSVLFDLLARRTRSSRFRHTADHLTLLGTLSAIPTAITGVADFSAIKKDAAGYGAAHGILNGIAFFCFARSSYARLRNRHGTGLFFSVIGLTFAMAGAWLGGDMVYRHRVGVNHAKGSGWEGWRIVMAAEDLEQDVPTRVEVEGQPVLLYRVLDDIYAIDAVCSHAGGPLEQGTVEDMCITCPWHQSVFDLRDGSVVHCPATMAQQRYRARIYNGAVEVARYMPSARAEPTREDEGVYV